MQAERTTADRLYEQAKVADRAADRAFARFFHGEVKDGGAAAQRLRAKADAAWVELRQHPDYDPERHDENFEEQQ